MELTVDDDDDDYDEDEDGEVELEESDESSDPPSPPTSQHPRADVLAQYPFKDEHSTVHDVLQHETAYVNLANKFLHEMGPNARKRAAVQVFRDMLEAGKSRMSSIDVEASLNVLGLSRPPMDQQRVERRMQLISETGNQSGWSDLGISSDQWLMLVDRCVQTALEKENHFRQALTTQQQRIVQHRQREAAMRSGSTTQPKPPRAKTFYQSYLSSSTGVGVAPGRSSSSQGLSRPTENRRHYESTPFADDERGDTTHPLMSGPLTALAHSQSPLLHPLLLPCLITSPSVTTTPSRFLSPLSASAAGTRASRPQHDERRVSRSQVTPLVLSYILPQPQP